MASIPAWIFTFFNSPFFLALAAFGGTLIGVKWSLAAGFKSQREEWKKRDEVAAKEERAKQTAAGKALAIELLHNHARLATMLVLGEATVPFSQIPELSVAQFEAQLPRIAELFECKDLHSVVKPYLMASVFLGALQIRGNSLIIPPEAIRLLQPCLKSFKEAYSIVAHLVFNTQESEAFEKTVLSIIPRTERADVSSSDK